MLKLNHSIFNLENYLLDNVCFLVELIDKRQEQVSHEPIHVEVFRRAIRCEDDDHSELAEGLE